jgi:pilus assembly protein CpaC
VTQSGQEASFLAGGEFPIPVPQGDGDITIEYKEFGVSLVFTPVVLSNGKISLRVAPSVSDIVSVQSIQTGIIGAEFVVPNLSVRKLETTVQLHDGQTLALAGLLQDKFFDRVEKIPGLGDLPIIGALFRSTSFREEKTELLIAVTPHLVKPVEAGSIWFPGDGLQPPNWYEFYLEGRLEGRRSVPDGSTTETLSAVDAVDGGGFEGAFGYQPVVAR